MPKPAYQAICDHIERDIRDGKLKRGDRVPSVRQMSRSWKVSQATVSRAFERLVKEGYLRSEERRGLFVAVASARTVTRPVGLFMQNAGGSASGSYAQDFLLGVQEAAQRGSIPLLIQNQPRQAPLDLRDFSDLHGAIIFERFGHDDILQLRDLSIPVTIADMDLTVSRFDSVISDNLDGMAEVVRHLHGVGCRSLAYVHANRDNSMHRHWDPALDARLDGFRLATRMLGLGADDIITPAAALVDAGKEAALALLQRERLPDAVVTYGHEAGHGVLAVLAEKGVGIPEQVSVTGFGRFHEDFLPGHRLGTAVFDSRQIGRMAMELLHWRGTHPDSAPRLERIPASFVPGTTTRTGDGPR